MSTNEWWMLALGISLGGVAGGWLTLKWAKARFKARLSVASEELRRHAALLQKGKASLARLQRELDDSRGAISRQMANRAAEPSAALARTEERLKAAYLELDLLRRRAEALDDDGDESTDGFAATRPMQDAL